MKNIAKRGAALLLAALLGAGSIPVGAVEIDAGESNSVPVQIVTEWSQIRSVINEYWQDDYFGELTIDPDNNQAKKDGENVSLRKQLDLSRAEAASVLDSAEAAEQYFEQSTDYEAFTDEDGIVHVRDPYQTCRLMVYADELAGDYGASEILHWAEYGEYMLQFDSREATQTAYEQLTAEVGADNCFTDCVYTGDMLLDSETELQTADRGSTSWGTSHMGLDVLRDDVESAGVTGTVTAAIIDTGIDTDHEFFDGRTITGYNFALYDDQAEDDYEDMDTIAKGHGTHVAGIVADSTPNNVTLMILRVFNPENKASLSAIVAALRYAGENGADVVNMSLGMLEDPENPEQGLTRALQDLYDKNIVVFASAGNEGMDHDTRGYSMTYPATLSTTIAVSALSLTGQLASYSSFGDAIDFTAPGSDILSAARGGGLRKDSGTSMATPFMTAAGAYIKLLHPDYTVSQVRSVLKSYAEDLGDKGWDERYGYGEVHMENYLADDKNGTNIGIPGTTSLEMQYTKMTYTGTTRENPVTVRLDGNGRALDPKYYTVEYINATNIGTATVQITGQNGYTGTLTANYTIIPQKTAITKLSNSAKKTMNIQWKTVQNCRGYQIQYATNSSFRNAKKISVVGSTKKSYKLTKLTKGKRYYVRIRTYKKVENTSIRGRWCDAKSVKISR